MIVFISCTKKKVDYKCEARELYSASQWFRGGYNYAKSLKPDKIFILSAKYGLLEEDQIIEPYEKSLISEKDAEVRHWSRMVIHQMMDKNVSRKEEAIFVCGKNYRKYISRYFIKSSAPLCHLGIGKQLAFFKNIRK